MTFLEWFELAGCASAILLVIKEGAAYYWTYRHSHFIEPKLRHQQMLLEQAKWFEERAQKLAVFRVQLRNTNPDKFKLAELVSKLDKHDWQFAMKETDLNVLVKWAEQKSQELQEGADETYRLAEEVGYKILSD